MKEVEVKEEKKETNKILIKLIKYEKLIAVALLLIFFFMAFVSMRNDAAIVDEVSHLTSGYMYLKLQI